MVRVKGGMSLRNGMSHGLRNDIIMQNLIYGKWCKGQFIRHASAVGLTEARHEHDFNSDVVPESNLIQCLHSSQYSGKR